MFYLQHLIVMFYMLTRLSSRLANPIQHSARTSPITSQLTIDHDTFLLRICSGVELPVIETLHMSVSLYDKVMENIITSYFTTPDYVGDHASPARSASSPFFLVPSPDFDYVRISVVSGGFSLSAFFPQQPLVQLVVTHVSLEPCACPVNHEKLHTFVGGNEEQKKNTHTRATKPVDKMEHIYIYRGGGERGRAPGGNDRYF